MIIYNNDGGMIPYNTGRIVIGEDCCIAYWKNTKEVFSYEHYEVDDAIDMAKGFIDFCDEESLEHRPRVPHWCTDEEI